MKVVLHGCHAKDDEEIDGQEFECYDLAEFINELRFSKYKQIHLNYMMLDGKEIDLDKWIQV